MLAMSVWSKVRDAVRDHRRVEQIEVRHVGEQTAMQGIIVREPCRRRETRGFCGARRIRRRLRPQEGRHLDRAELERPLLLQYPAQPGGSARKYTSRDSRRRDLPAPAPAGMGELMLESALGRLKRGGHVEDLLAVLNRDHPTGRRSDCRRARGQPRRRSGN